VHDKGTFNAPQLPVDALDSLAYSLLGHKNDYHTDQIRTLAPHRVVLNPRVGQRQYIACKHAGQACVAVTAMPGTPIQCMNKLNICWLHNPVHVLRYATRSHKLHVNDQYDRHAVMAPSVCHAALALEQQQNVKPAV
jgi:hypothetical protein